MPLLRSGHTGADAVISRGDTSADTLLRSMNSVRGEAIDAGTWLLYRLLEGESDTRDGADVEAALFAAAREQTAFTAVTFGRALPLLLEADERHGDHRWRDSLRPMSSSDSASRSGRDTCSPGHDQSGR